MNQQSKFRKAVLILLAVFLVASCLFAASAAAKEEVVYANLDKNGGVEGVYVVNIFDYKELIQAVAADPKEPVIVDYGDYSSVKNLVTTEPIVKTGADEYTIYLEPPILADGKLYYQGNMRDPVIPWSIDVTYFLNGQEISAEDVSGAAGHVTVVIKIAADPAYGRDNYFYKNYALMVTVLLDANKCLNIVSKDATMANNGANKQLSYTILPDRDTEIIIDTDTVDFYMGEININGVRLSLHISTDSIDMSDVDDLKDGVKKLTDTAYTLLTLTSSHYAKTTYLPEGGLNTTIRSEAQKIATVTNELYNNLVKLKNETKDMDTKITDKVNGVIDPLSKNPQQLKSFASDKNTDVERVQFVIHTKEIKVDDSKQSEITPEKELTFFERILALFGITL